MCVVVLGMKLSWPKTLVKKWLNIKSKAEDFHADDIVCEGPFHWSISYMHDLDVNLRFWIWGILGITARAKWVSLFLWYNYFLGFDWGLLLLFAVQDLSFVFFLLVNFLSFSPLLLFFCNLKCFCFLVVELNVVWCGIDAYFRTVEELGFNALYASSFSGGDEEWRNTYSEREACTIKKSKTGSV